MNLEPTDRGMLLGDGVFETIKVINGEIQFLTQHFQRLAKSCATLKIPLDIDQHAFKARISETIRAEKLEDNTAVVRFTITRGSGPRGLAPMDKMTPNMFITADVSKPTKKKLSACISTIRRNEQSPLANIKSLSYLDNVLAKMEAVEHGFDEAILLNTKDNVTCASCANIFIKKGGALYTPTLSDGALPGIMRAHVIKQESAIEKTIALQELLTADEVFITNALIGKSLVTSVTPIVDKQGDVL